MSPRRIERLQRMWSFDLPGVKPYYAVKCNPDPNLLQILRSWAFGFDCASPRELSLMNGKGQMADDIVYANPCKSDRDLEYAKEHGSPLTVVDSAEEVTKLKMYDYKGGALIRIRVDDSGSAMPFNGKFGLRSESVGALGDWARKCGIGLRGISFHVGSSSSDYKAHAKGIETAIDATKVLREQGHRADIVDIGGGFIPTSAPFTMTAMNIRQTIRQKGGAGLRFIAEPGRFFATESQDLFVQVIGKKPAFGGGWRYTIDESLYGQFTNILFDQQKPRWVRVPRKEGEAARNRGRGIVFGRTCDSLDVIARSENMEELDIGDWLWFPHMGAYTTVTASEFNGFPKPPVFLDEEDDLPEVTHSLLHKSVSDIQYLKAVTAGDMLSEKIEPGIPQL